MRKLFISFYLLQTLFLLWSSSAWSQDALGYIAVEGNDGQLSLRVISVADAISEGNGVVKMKLPDGTIGAAHLVSTSDPSASPVRIQTPYGTRSWRKESQFAYAYGGAASENSSSIIATSDGGFALGGSTTSWGEGPRDQFLIKTNEAGALSWAGVYGGPNTESGNVVLQRNDGGYLLLGTTSNSPISYMYLNFIDASGNSTLEGYFQPASGNSTGYDAIQTSDNNFVGVGYVDGFGNGADLYLKKFDISGGNIWGNVFDYGGDEVGNAVVQRPDGGFVVVGWMHLPNTSQDAFYCLLDSDGVEEATYSTGGSGIEEAKAVTSAGDGGYVFVGQTSSFGAGSWDVYMVKMSAAGTMVFSKSFGGSGVDFGYDIIKTRDGGFAIAGRTYSFGVGNSDVWLIKTDSAGNGQWSWIFGGTGYEYANSIIQTSDGCYYISGSTDSYGEGMSDVLFIKFTPDGESCLGYAVGFSSDMASLEENDDTFKARRFDDFMVTDIPNCDRVIHPKSQRLKEKFKVNASPSRDFVTPTTTTICD